jgi:hypothetical protein
MHWVCGLLHSRLRAHEPAASLAPITQALLCWFKAHGIGITLDHLRLTASQFADDSTCVLESGVACPMTIAAAHALPSA